MCRAISPKFNSVLTAHYVYLWNVWSLFLSFVRLHIKANQKRRTEREKHVWKRSGLITSCGAVLFVRWFTYPNTANFKRLFICISFMWPDRSEEERRLTSVVENARKSEWKLMVEPRVLAFITSSMHVHLIQTRKRVIQFKLICFHAQCDRKPSQALLLCSLPSVSSV